jgi:N-acetyl-gamma-glutamyl-phosphate reductase
MKIGIVGASGYSGGELLRLLLNHPHFELAYIAAGSSAGEPITSIHPGLRALSGQLFEVTDEKRVNECDLVFIALPHGESAKLISKISPHVKVVDLGADFRLHSRAAWEKYYGGVHAGTWTYGLSELPGAKEKIAEASHIANPGCYATSIILAAAPAITHRLIDESDLVTVAASGTTGAGRKASTRLLASEVMGSMSHYKFGGSHQHTPEVEEVLARLSKTEKVGFSFTPMLAPMPRGILATTTAKLTSSTSHQEVYEIYSDFYADKPFVSLLPLGEMPSTSATVGSNSALLQVAVDQHTNRLVVSSALDNLGKGAAGQAIQNANLISGYSETLGLSTTGLGA